MEVQDIWLLYGRPAPTGRCDILANSTMERCSSSANMAQWALDAGQRSTGLWARAGRAQVRGVAGLL